MKSKHVWWTAASVVTAAAVAGLATLGVAVQEINGNLTHDPAPTVAHAKPVMVPLAAGDAPDAEALSARLDGLARDAALGTLGGQVIDTTTGEVVWEREAGTPAVPASATKILTTAAAILSLDTGARVNTEVVRGPQDGTVVIKAAGDTWMTHEQLDDLAEQITAAGGASAVYIDTGLWSGNTQAPAWDPDNVDGGYVAPMEPAMAYGGRLGGTEGDLPRSHTPALDVANLLAQRLGAQTAGLAPAPGGAEVVASTQSAPLAQRMQQMVKHSDNVAAEAIGREVAAAQGAEPSFAGATRATLETLERAGFDTEATVLSDNSGLSTNNRITPALLTSVVSRAVTDESLRPLLGYLPVAGGEGTLATRYSTQSGKGYVRAKTGSLTGVSALVGTAVGKSGHVYAFSFLVNDAGDLLSTRVAQDALASALTEF